MQGRNRGSPMVSPWGGSGGPAQFGLAPSGIPEMATTSAVAPYIQAEGRPPGGKTNSEGAGRALVSLKSPTLLDLLGVAAVGWVSGGRRGNRQGGVQGPHHPQAEHATHSYCPSFPAKSVPLARREPLSLPRGRGVTVPVQP